MTQNNHARATARWIRPCNHNAQARRRAEDISAQLATALAAAAPMVAAGFDLCASVALSAEEGGGLLRFRCSPEEVQCFCAADDGPLLITPVAGRVLN